MRSMFDTNVYISFIRNRSHSSEMQRRGTVKYLSAIVLMELWAGSRTKKAKKPAPTAASRRIGARSMHPLEPESILSGQSYRPEPTCRITYPSDSLLASSKRAPLWSNFLTRKLQGEHLGVIGIFITGIVEQRHSEIVFFSGIKGHVVIMSGIQRAK